jgi:hypothetical protein
MSHIYANASITLSATWAANPSQGCFGKLDEQYVSRTGTFRNTDRGTYELHCHEMLPQFDSPLQNRGWVFQERMLSKRIVHFMGQELLWECLQCFTCECRSKTHSQNQQWFGGSKDRTAKLMELSRLDAMLTPWEEVVRSYRSRSLTYPSDIFPALQGLAKLVPSSMGRYLAGHWESSLTISLCWNVVLVSQAHHKDWRAPSWSWAAAKGPVAWPHYRPDPIIETYTTLVSATIIPKGDDPTGQLAYGDIVLRGKLLSGRMQETRLPMLYRNGYGLALDWAKHHGAPEENLFLPDWDDEDQCEGGKLVVALKVCGTRHLGPSKRELRDQFWLVLKASESTEGEYVRVGILQLQGEYEKASRIEQLDALYDKAVEMDIKIV